MASRNQLQIEGQTLNNSHLVNKNSLELIKQYFNIILRT